MPSLLDWLTHGYIEVRFDMDKTIQIAQGFALLLCVFLIALDPPSWAPSYVQWAWKGVIAAAAFYRGLHTEKPEKI